MSNWPVILGTALSHGSAVECVVPFSRHRYAAPAVVGALRAAQPFGHDPRRAAGPNGKSLSNGLVTPGRKFVGLDGRSLAEPLNTVHPGSARLWR